MEEGSHRTILKSTAIMGSSQIIAIGLGILRTKFMAMLLGTSGVGIVGLYSTITGLIGTISGMGIGISGVRQIAECQRINDINALEKTVKTIKIMSVVTGFIGVAILVVFSNQISIMTFGDSKYSYELKVLAISMIFTSIASGQTAVIQGMRRVGILANMGILNSALGLIVTVPIIYMLGEDGIIISLISLSVVSAITGWWFVRKIKLAELHLDLIETLKRSKKLLQLGFVFMMSILMASGVGYCIRVLVLNGHGVDGVGLYQASTTLASLYIGLILNAMGVDFYPRLTEVAQDNEACNKLVNEQTEVGLLLAVPGIFATLTFTPLILSIFYSDAFIPAYQILRWEILGVFLRVISWPIAFILLAKKTSKIIFYTELVANLFYLSMAIVGLNYFGLEGAGIAFFSLYVFHVLAMVYIGRKVSNFSWTRSNFYQIITLSLIVISLVAIQFISSSLVSYIVGSFITIGSVSYSAIKLKKYLSSRH